MNATEFLKAKAKVQTIGGKEYTKQLFDAAREAMDKEYDMAQATLRAEAALARIERERHVAELAGIEETAGV
jgi:hypothetical protein